MRVANARRDPNVFIQYALTNEENGRPLKQAPHHIAWQKLLAKHRNVVIWAHVEAGKTQNVSIGRIIWELGRDPTLRIAIVSNTHGQATKILGAIKKNIESNERIREVFPKLVKGEQWNENAITVQRSTIAKDPSIQAFGLHGAVLGARLDLIVLDDILDFENTLTHDQREKAWGWLQATLHGRLTARSRVWIVGTAFHPEDALHRYAALPGYKAVRYPVIDEAGNPRWPEQWPLDRILQRRDTTTPAEFDRQLLCIAQDEATRRFKRAWIEVALERGRGRRFAWALKRVPPGCKTIVGVDLAVQKKKHNDETVLFTMLVRPNGDREVLWIEAGRWGGPEIIERILDHQRRYLALFIVENNAAQDYIVQFTRDQTDVPVQGFTTGKNKADPNFGIEGMATEFANGKWIIPNDRDEHGRILLDPEVTKWIDEILNYDPRAHTGDRLMASWFAQQGVAISRQRNETGGSIVRR